MRYLISVLHRVASISVTCSGSSCTALELTPIEIRMVAALLRRSWKRASRDTVEQNRTCIFDLIEDASVMKTL